MTNQDNRRGDLRLQAFLRRLHAHGIELRLAQNRKIIAKPSSLLIRRDQQQLHEHRHRLEQLLPLLDG